MLTIYDDQTALPRDLPADLRTLIEGHLTSAREQGLAELTHIAVIQPHDTEEVIANELGFSPFHNSLTGKRYGQAGFQPNWDWLEVHPGWFELIYTVGDSGFAFVLFTEKGESELARMCESFTRRR